MVLNSLKIKNLLALLLNNSETYSNKIPDGKVRIGGELKMHKRKFPIFRLRKFVIILKFDNFEPVTIIRISFFFS